MDELLKVLDKNFRKETVDSSYAACVDFENLSRQNKTVENILEFERRYNKLKALNMLLPDEIRGCKLLENSGLDVKEKHMVLTSVKSLNYEEIKSSMRKIFGEIATTSEQTSQQIKTEVFSIKPNDRTKFSGIGKKANPKNKYGKTSRCASCGSIYHWVKDCPDFDSAENSRRKAEDALVTDVEREEDPLFTLALSTGTKLLSECINRAIIDTGCTKSVSGSSWLELLILSLDGKGKKS